MKRLTAHGSDEAWGWNPPASRALCCLLLIALFSGCSAIRGWRHTDYVAKHPCQLPKNPTVAEVIDHVNANVEKIHGWSSDAVRIRASGVPVTLAGHMYVERAHRLRLEVKSPMGKEVDFGSNDQVFWMWSKRNQQGKEPAPLIFASHEDMDAARRRMPMPFEPPWLMEALGVSPLSADGVKMEGEPRVAVIKLVSQHQMPDGSAVRKVVSVHGCHGYVMDHTVYNSRGEPLVRAAMTDYRFDPKTGAMLPRHIKLDWPQEQVSLAMEFPSIEVNPSSIPDMVWEMPQIPGAPVVDIGAGAKPRPVQIADVPTRSRTDLIDPDNVSPAGNESFELPQLNRPRPAVELEPIEFEPPVTDEPAGRASMPVWRE